MHINSGIPNRAFALAATDVGGEAWLGVGQVWYDVLTGPRITPQCDFATFARLTIDAAGARFGTSGREGDAVRRAWQTVGVAPAATAGGGMPSGTTGRAPGDAELSVGRSGGFAGVSQATTVRLSELPVADAEAWRSLLGSGALRGSWERDPAGPLRDGFCYTVVSEAHGIDASLDEEVLPGAVRNLFDRTLRGGH